MEIRCEDFYDLKDLKDFDDFDFKKDQVINIETMVNENWLREKYEVYRIWYFEE